MPPKEYPLVSFRTDDDLTQSLENRTREGERPHRIAQRDLERYYALLDRERRVLNGLFSVAELSLLVDSCNGTMFEAHTMGYLSAGVTDSIELDALDEKWKVDGASLLARLEGLSSGATWALVDFIERFWAKPGNALSADGFMALGIVPGND